MDARLRQIQIGPNFTQVMQQRRGQVVSPLRFNRYSVSQEFKDKYGDHAIIEQMGYHRFWMMHDRDINAVDYGARIHHSGRRLVGLPSFKDDFFGLAHRRRYRRFADSIDKHRVDEQLDVLGRPMMDTCFLKLLIKRFDDMYDNYGQFHTQLHDKMKASFGQGLESMRDAEAKKYWEKKTTIYPGIDVSTFKDFAVPDINRGVSEAEILKDEARLQVEKDRFERMENMCIPQKEQALVAYVETYKLNWDEVSKDHDLVPDYFHPVLEWDYPEGQGPYGATMSDYDYGEFGNSNEVEVEELSQAATRQTEEPTEPGSLSIKKPSSFKARLPRNYDRQRRLEYLANTRKDTEIGDATPPSNRPQSPAGQVISETLATLTPTLPQPSFDYLTGLLRYTQINGTDPRDGLADQLAKHCNLNHNGKRPAPTDLEPTANKRSKQ